MITLTHLYDSKAQELINYFIGSINYHYLDEDTTRKNYICELFEECERAKDYLIRGDASKLIKAVTEWLQDDQPCLMIATYYKDIEHVLLGLGFDDSQIEEFDLINNYYELLARAFISLHYKVSRMRKIKVNFEDSSYNFTTNVNGSNDVLKIHYVNSYFAFSEIVEHSDGDNYELKITETNVKCTSIEFI